MSSHCGQPAEVLEVEREHNVVRVRLACKVCSHDGWLERPIMPTPPRSRAEYLRDVYAAARLGAL